MQCTQAQAQANMPTRAQRHVRVLTHSPRETGTQVNTAKPPAELSKCFVDVAPAYVSVTDNSGQVQVQNSRNALLV